MLTSPSALKLYAQCPRRYRLVHLDRRREPPTPHLYVGNVVHQALREFFDLPLTDRKWAALELALRRAWAAGPERAQVFPRTADEARAGVEALAHLKRFFEQADTKARPFALEVFLMTEVGEGVMVRGKVAGRTARGTAG